MKDLDLASVPPNLDTLHSKQIRQFSEVLPHMAMHFIFLFNEEQGKVFNQVFGAVISGVQPDISDVDSTSVAITERMFFPGARRGTGKTFLSSAIQRFLKSTRKSVLTSASSIVAAQLFGNEIIAHSALQIPISGVQDGIHTESADSPLVGFKRIICLLDWDGVVMSHRRNMESIERTFRDVMCST